MHSRFVSSPEKPSIWWGFAFSQERDQNKLWVCSTVQRPAPVQGEVTDALQSPWPCTTLLDANVMFRRVRTTIVFGFHRFSGNFCQRWLKTRSPELDRNRKFCPTSDWQPLEANDEPRKSIVSNSSLRNTFRTRRFSWETPISEILHSHKKGSPE